jgi:hypothetical protein
LRAIYFTVVIVRESGQSSSPYATDYRMAPRLLDAPLSQGMTRGGRDMTNGLAIL